MKALNETAGTGSPSPTEVSSLPEATCFVPTAYSVIIEKQKDKNLNPLREDHLNSKGILSWTWGPLYCCLRGCHSSLRVDIKSRPIKKNAAMDNSAARWLSNMLEIRPKTSGPKIADPLPAKAINPKNSPAWPSGAN